MTPALLDNFEDMELMTGSDRDDAIRSPRFSRPGMVTTLWHSLFLSAVVVLLSLGCMAVQRLTSLGYVFVGYVFLLGVVSAALRFRRGPVLFMAAFCAVVWDYFFIPPVYNFSIPNPDDQAMFGMFFIVALSMGHLTTRLRQREEAERRLRRHTSALLTITESAALSPNPEKGLTEAMGHISNVLLAKTCLVLRAKDQTQLATESHSASCFTPRPGEWEVMRWAFEHQARAGRSTEHFPQAEGAWYPLQTATATMGVLGVRFQTSAVIDNSMHQTIEAFALQLALVLEKERFVEAMREAEVVARSEALYRTLLDNLSHELKTPLAVIQGSLESMDVAANPFLGEIHIANQRLQRIVNGLIQMSRVEADTIRPHHEWCDLTEVLENAQSEAADVLRGHPVEIIQPVDLPMVKLDQLLLTQALANVLHNAGFHTPRGTKIHLSAEFADAMLRLRVRDDGPGLPPQAEEKVFEKFYRSPNAVAGGTGLGLTIARGLVRAEGGNITARNHPEGGAEFLLEFKAEPLPPRSAATGA